MLSLYLENDIKQFNGKVKKIKKEKPGLIALQGAPRLTEDEIRSMILLPLDHEYSAFRGDILHKTDNILLVRRGANQTKLISDTSAHEWMLESNVSMCGVILESNEDNFRQAIFSVFVEPGATEGDVIDNAFFIRKVLSSEMLSSDNLVLLCEFLDETYIKLFERILEIRIDVGSRRRSTRRRLNGS